MGELYDLCHQITQEIEERASTPMEALRLKGELAREVGFMVSMVALKDPDDPARIARVRDAARKLEIRV